MTAVRERALADATAIVLAGGSSSRMGHPKALLPFDGQPLILHVVTMLGGLFGEVLVVAAPGQELPCMPARVVRDSVPRRGPAQGIRDGLGAAAHRVAFVASCDSAFLNPGLIAHLVSRISPYDIVVPYWLERCQPLHAVYRTRVVPLLDAQLARGELRPAALFDKVPTCRVGPDEIRRHDPEGASLFNMNTPEDYAEALKRWHEVAAVRGLPPMRRRCRRGRPGAGPARTAFEPSLLLAGQK